MRVLGLGRVGPFRGGRRAPILIVLARLIWTLVRAFLNCFGWYATSVRCRCRSRLGRRGLRRVVLLRGMSCFALMSRSRKYKIKGSSTSTTKITSPDPDGIPSNITDDSVDVVNRARI